MTARDALYEAWRAGQEPKARLVVQTITSLEELDAYRQGLSQRGALDADAMAAIKSRQDYLAAKEGKL